MFPIDDDLTLPKKYIHSLEDTHIGKVTKENMNQGHLKQNHSWSLSRATRQNKIDLAQDLRSWCFSYIETAVDEHNRIIHKSLLIKWMLFYTETNKTKKC